MLFPDTLHTHQMAHILQISEVSEKCRLVQEGNLSGCGSDKREIEKIWRVFYYLFIYGLLYDATCSSRRTFE